MQTEYEVRILEINQEELIKKIEELGGELVGSFEQKRYVYDFKPVNPNKWIRLRTDGAKTTLAIKEVGSDTIDGTKELETIVGDFAKTNQILNELGYLDKGYQENRRIRYMLNGVELDIDSWPLIPTYLEIEGQSEAEVNKVMDLLKIDKAKATFKSVMSIYSDFYNINIEKVKELKF